MVSFAVLTVMNSRVGAWLPGGRKPVGASDFGSAGIFKVDAIELHGVGALLDLRVNGSDVLTHHAEERSWRDEMKNTPINVGARPKLDVDQKTSLRIR
jgi:hypothetical protein